MSEPPNRRWLRLSPDRFILGLPVVECLIWLSQSWFDKGWAVLFALGGVGVAFLLMLVWFGASLTSHCRFQFSVRSLFLLAVVVAIPCSWLAVERKHARQQSETVKWIENWGGSVTYDWQLPLDFTFLSQNQPPGPLWLRDLLGDDFFLSVNRIDILGIQIRDDELARFKIFTQLRYLNLAGSRITDAGLEVLEGFPELKVLWLGIRGFTDAGLEHLKGLRQLRILVLYNSQLTDAAVAELQKALPNCTIERDPQVGVNCNIKEVGSR